jgi:spore coat polysaccharide biosynthesis protein SpsF (cytidylyltransferase family)
MLLIACEVDPEAPACWKCEYSTIDEYWEDTFCDMTYDEIKDYEFQVFHESGGKIEVECYWQ